MLDLPFRDRRDAGRRLGVELKRLQLPGKTTVLALPRGGVPVAVEAAKILHVPLDILVVRKLGVPWQPELALGAIAGETRVLDRHLIAELGITEEEIEDVAARETEEMERRATLYRSGRPATDLHGRTVVLIDDGLAMGSTMVAAARHVRSSDPRKLIVAVPVASTQACARLEREADECICLATPVPFSAVGEWYTDFGQVTDAEVQDLLRQNLDEFQSAPQS